MARSVSEAARGSGEIAQTINQLAESAQHTSTGSTQSQQAVQELSRLSGQLRSAVATFTLLPAGRNQSVRHASRGGARQVRGDV